LAPIFHQDPIDRGSAIVACLKWIGGRILASGLVAACHPGQCL